MLVLVAILFGIVCSLCFTIAGRIVGGQNGEIAGLLISFPICFLAGFIFGGRRR